jgi:hypothetical protein
MVNTNHYIHYFILDKLKFYKQLWAKEKEKVKEKDKEKDKVKEKE